MTRNDRPKGQGRLPDRAERRQAVPAPHPPPDSGNASEPPIRRNVLAWLAHASLVLAGLAVFGLFLSAVSVARRPPDAVAIAMEPTLPTPTRASTRTPSPTATPSFTPTPDIPRIGIVAGHSGGIDPGASCMDGLREVDITTDVAARAKSILEKRGYTVDILEEFDSRLMDGKRDYGPKAFLAIHADSCVWYASGYKVARAASSASPDEDDRLVRCVSAEYAAATELPFHAGSITIDMTHYHGLNQIAPESPGAIIELGFLGSNHDLLMYHRDILAQGVANGLDDFMRGDQCKSSEQ